jgi:hypothetical protein
MVATTVQKKRTLIPALVYQRPFLGLIAISTLLAYQMFGHTFTMIQREYLDHTAIFYMDLVIGASGFVFVWRGFGKDELTATCYGALGGAMIWFGWFESTFELVAGPMNIDDVMFNGELYFGGGIQILEATGAFIIPVLMLLGLNKDTRCRFFLWFQRNLNLKPETSTVGYRRQYSRITALEYIFITWFIYVVDLILLDPRILGPESMLMWGLFGAFTIWAGYLFFYKMPQQTGVAPTIRYAIGAGIVVWLIPETLAAAQMMIEIWLRPFEYPITMTLVTIYMFIGCYVLSTAPDRGALPKVKKYQGLSETQPA